jgi:hypothetical protein
MLTLRAEIYTRTQKIMSELFVISNQLGHFWGKSKTWVDGSDARSVMRTKHRDEATNTLFELSSKDFELRGDIVAAQASPKGEPMVQVSDIPLPVVPQEDDQPEPEDEEPSIPEEQGQQATTPTDNQPG